MKTGKILGVFILFSALLLVVGTGVWLMLADVPVHQSEVSQEIPHDRFSQ